MPGSGPRRLPRGAGRLAAPGGLLPRGQTLPRLRNAGCAPELRRAGSRASGAEEWSRRGTLSGLSALRSKCRDLGDEERLGGIRAAEGTIRGTPPMVHTPPLANIGVHSFIYSVIHACIHSPAISTPSSDCPPHKGWRFPAGPRVEGGVSASFPFQRGLVVVAACGGPGGSVELSQHDSAAPVRQARPGRAGSGRSLSLEI